MTRDPTSLVRQLLDAAVRAGFAPGLVAGWMRAGERTPSVVAVGSAVVGRPPTAATAGTWFDLASLTKPLVIGTLSLLALRDERLSLATPVGEILPDAADAKLGERTVRQLLTHTAGLPAWVPLYALTSRSRTSILEILCGLPLGRPDTHVVYSCPGFILLGMMLDRVTGSSLDRVFVERVLQPMTLDTVLDFRPDPTLPLAGRAASPETERQLLVERGLDPASIPTTGPGLPDDGNARFLGGVAGNAGLFGTVAGVLELARVYLDDDGFFSAEERTLATTNHTPGLEQARGLGWQMATSPGCSAGPALAPTAFGHTGFTGTSVWADPTRGLTMALLANRVHPGHRETDLHPLRRRFHQLVVEAHA